MQIPNQILSKILKDNGLAATVHSALENCKHIISTHPEFFPEYTDHSAQHNEDVLLTSITILTDEAFERLSPHDFTALTIAIILHDCGMHLTGDTFKQLVSPDNKIRTMLDTDNWSSIWNEFLMEAKRFDGRQLKRLFGSTDPIRIPPDNPSDFTARDKLLIGEFLRRHHPRLAHEIAVFGFPSVGGNRIKIIPERSDDLAEMAGIIARSHGMPLRQAIDIFEKHYHHREYQKVHPPILMATLRIADYLQIQPERAPSGRQEIRKIHSPFSTGEWKVHQSVRNITPAGSDPEAIFIDAAPEDIDTFLRFKNWASSFQSELDKTWAALGEVYGRFTNEEFDKFNLRLRRIHTSIDDIKMFSENSTFIPEKISFDASSPDLLSLLVAPLYGNRPEVGLRELIQNSVDSVIEYNFVKEDNKKELLNGHDTDVIIYPIVNENYVSKVVISDRGIGMNSNIIQNYFLKAGASFRNSGHWKKNFTDDFGNSKISRTGRFGIGALAGFLLGNKIHVSTRRYDSDHGLDFEAELDTESIEVRKMDFPIGTTITIDISDENKENITRMFRNKNEIWDWYCNTTPKVTRIGLKNEIITQKLSVEDKESWPKCEIKKYQEVRWKTTNKGFSLYRENIYCNGIKICNSSEIFEEKNRKAHKTKIGNDSALKYPTILISDNDGALPIDLQRNGFTEEEFELKKSLIESISKDIIAEALAKAPEHDAFHPKIPDIISKTTLNYYIEQDFYWVWEDDGWKISDMSVSGKKEWICVFFEHFDLSSLSHKREIFSNVTLGWEKLKYTSPNNFENCKYFIRNFISEAFWNRESHDRPSKVFFSQKVLEKLSSGKLPNYMESKIKHHVSQNKGQCTLSIGNIKHQLTDELNQILLTNNSKDFNFAFVGGKNKSTTSETRALSVAWQNFIGDLSIPPDFEMRREMFPKAFSQLGERIQYYRNQQLKDTKTTL